MQYTTLIKQRDVNFTAVKTSNEYPCIYKNLSIDDYHSSVGISRSALLLLRRSPLHFWDKYLNPLKELNIEKKEYIFGNAFHTFILENETFNDRYAILPDNLDKRTKKGKELYEDFLNHNKNKLHVSRDEYQTILNMSRQINNSSLSRDLVNGDHIKIENSIYWHNNKYNILCKARPDCLHSSLVVDLKTTHDASPSSFKRQIYEYGYHIQAAMIQDGVYNLTGKNITDFVFLAVEKTRPFAIGIYTLSDEALEIGREEYSRLILLYKDCIDKNEWPSYNIEEISLFKRIY